MSRIAFIALAAGIWWSANTAQFGQQTVRLIDQKLIDATQKGSATTVKALLAKGANPNAVSQAGQPPLFELGGTASQRLEIAKLLLAKGAKVNYIEPHQKYSVLTHAIVSSGAMSDITPLVNLFLDHGAKVDQPMDDGTTALILAVRFDKLSTVKLLLDRHANVNARTHPAPPVKFDRSGFGFDKDYEKEMAAERAQSEKQMTEMNDRMFEPGFKSSGTSAIFEAINIRGNREMLTTLVSHGASIKSIDDNGWTLLHYAVKQGNAQAVMELIRMGLDVNAGSKGGFRPLHIAMRVGFYMPLKSMAELLLTNHADRNLKNNAGQTPLQLLIDDTTSLLKAMQHNPQMQGNIGSADQLLAISNAVAKVLDPSAKPIGIPARTVDAKGTRYESFFIAGIQFERAVRFENGKIVLELWTRDGPSEPKTISIDMLELNHYEPITHFPLKLEVKKGTAILVTYPKEAAEGGGALTLAYSYKHGQGGGSGNINEGASVDFAFSQSAATGFKGMEISHELKGRTIIMHIDEVKVAGKVVAALTGKEFSVVGGTPTVIPGLAFQKDGVKAAIKYKVRILPSKVWVSKSMDLSH